MKAVFFHGVPGGGALGVLLRSTACCSSPGWRLGGGRGGGEGSQEDPLSTAVSHQKTPSPCRQLLSS